MRQAMRPPIQAASLYLKLLVGRQAELLTELRYKREDPDTVREPVMEQDQPAITRESKIAEKLSALESHELARVNTALEKLRLGTYGICENCHSPIPPARLKAIPWAERCCKCESAAPEGMMAAGLRV